MDITKIGHGENPDAVNAIIEVPLNSSIKYEIDKDSGAARVDRVLYSAMHYPANYGFVANTLSDDGDPADILVLCDYALQTGSYIKCRLVGVLITEDENGGDEKLLAVPTTKTDPTYAKINDIDDLPEHTLNRIKNFFETYKMLEPNKWVKVSGFQDKKAAEKILDKAIRNYK
ncbi:MAG: inorganic pyrophosphatase [Epsilonproteobacteria bacterium (ex Lamellibrachia satsuma)]|nr:MAG: inorganic pyrophosphatase [Epsilonproteobacteria bacterium (ex Lamellibrachia satsuma)]